MDVSEPERAMSALTTPSSRIRLLYSSEKMYRKCAYMHVHVVVHLVNDHYPCITAKTLLLPVEQRPYLLVST